jgi:hypothetical protein
MDSNGMKQVSVTSSCEYENEFSVFKKHEYSRPADPH